MALRKLMTLKEIRKHRKNIWKSLSALSNELELLAMESQRFNLDDKGEADLTYYDQTDEEDFVEDKIYGFEGADEIISDLMNMIQENRLDVKYKRQNS